MRPVLPQRRNQRRHPEEDDDRIVSSQSGDECEESDTGQDESAHARHVPHPFGRSIPITWPRSTVGKETDEPNESDQEHGKHRELCPGDHEGNHHPKSARGSQASYEEYATASLTIRGLFRTTMAASVGTEMGRFTLLWYSPT
jgi:hypothetical protein